jgi:hypothetical protein
MSNATPRLTDKVKRKSNRTTGGLSETLASQEHTSKGVCARAGWCGGEKSLVATIDCPGADLDVGVESSGRAGPCAPPAELRQGYHCACWSNRYSGSGCARASQSGTASASPSSDAGGPHAGAIGGASAGSPMRVKIRSPGAASVIKATMRMAALQ